MTKKLDERRASRQERRATARGQRSGGSGSMPRWLLPAALVGALLVAGVIALVLPGTDRPSTGTSTLPPSAAVATGAASSVPSISGAQLPDFQNPDGDAAVGLAAPLVSGTDFSGKSVKIEADGRGKAIMFIAHWCPHCQREVPLVEAWVKTGGAPANVDLLSVATSIDANRPNYPPDAWLQREGWTVPVIADPTNSVASAYGLTAFPYWVFVGPDGKVKARTVGELPVATLRSMMESVAGG